MNNDAGEAIKGFTLAALVVYPIDSYLSQRHH